MDELRQDKAANTALYLKRDEIDTIPSISRVQRKSVLLSEHCLIMALHDYRFRRHGEHQGDPDARRRALKLTCRALQPGEKPVR